jgi:membrane protease YdiL (CAAX protease family)
MVASMATSAVLTMIASSTGPRSERRPTAAVEVFVTLDSKTRSGSRIPHPAGSFGESRQNGRMRLALLALLLVVLGLLAWRAATRSRDTYRRFKRLSSTRARKKVYGRWLLESAIVMSGLSAAVLLAAWPYAGRALHETQSWAPIAAVRGFLGTPGGVVVSIVAVVVVAVALIVPVIVLRSSVSQGDLGDIPAVGDIRALLPRARGELKFGLGLGLSAGIFEELLFRLAMPALIFGIISPGPSAFGAVAFALAALAFGMLHLYQGPLGILFATLLGLVFAALYVLTGSIAAPIVLHALVDLRTLVLIPVVGGAWHLRGDAPARAS